MKTDSTPSIFWHSSPVGPDETLVLSGGNFSDDSIVELAQVVDAQNLDWQAVKPLQLSDVSLKAIVPSAWKPGIFACRVKSGKAVSRTVYLNAPEIWWKQGDEGVDRTRQGGWLRLLGNCLSIGAKASVSLRSANGVETALELESISLYSLKVKIPLSLEVGRYTVIAGNGSGGKDGLRDAASLEILPARTAPEIVLSVLDFGADPSGMKDSTLAIVQITERLSCLGGGVILFPSGRYRIDSVLRSGTWIESPLLIPENVTLRGEGQDLTSLWWPDHEKALPTLIDGRNNFAIEELSIYTQGRHSTIISGSSNVRITNVRIRANCYYMTNNNGGQHHLRKIEGQAASGAAILLWGENNQVTGCDILNSVCAFDIRIGRGNLIAGNQVRASNFHWMSGVSEMIFEDNSFTGNHLTAGGCNIALHFGGSICKHVYYAHNSSSHIYGGDHECLTFDGHGSAFVGRVKNVDGATFTLLKINTPSSKPLRGHMADMYGTAVYIVDGRGVGQYRWIKGYEGDNVTLDRPWDIEPDSSSIISIGGFNGRHLLIGNSGTDTGTLIQLYPSNCECVVAENRGIRASNINSLGKIGKECKTGHAFIEVSWYNQFLDNHVVVGNAWGGGSTQVDRWIGGEPTLNIWGWEVSFRVTDEGCDLDEFLTPEDLMSITGEDSPRQRSIPVSRFQIIRRHKVDSNSSIRIHGAIADVLIEKCDMKLSRKGIRIDMEMDYRQPEDIGQLFDFDPESGPENKPMPFLSPEGVLIRGNSFKDVKIPFSGTALETALKLN